MAQDGRRQVVSDPLAQKAGGQTPDRSLSLGGLQRPSGGGNAASQDALNGLSAIGNIRTAVAQVTEARTDELIVKGKMDFMTGVTEQEMLRSGNKYTQQGYEALSSIDKASAWYQSELVAIDETTRDMPPAEYQKYLMEKRKSALSNLPEDPAVRKLYVAAFENYGPRLAEEQFKAHNDRNRSRTINETSNALYSSSGANEDASRVMPGGPLRVSPGVVSPTIQTSARDRDIGIRTMLGEAGGEGEVGMAAVAHVLKNRTIDGGYGGRTIGDVAMAPKQFSAWNEGPGGIPAIRNWSTESKAYQRAAKVYDAVMGGHNADMTNGSTHYFSPKGMQALKAGGSQSHLVPTWWAAESAKGQVTIGNHKFGGKARGLDGFISREPLAAGESPVPEHTTGQSQLRATLDNVNLRDEDKALAVTDAMVRSLEEGNDQLYNDIGGEAYLRSIGGTGAQINAVQAARARATKATQDKFSVDMLRDEEDFTTQIKAGKFKSVEEVGRFAEMLSDHHGQDEAYNKKLANSAVTEWNKYNDDHAPVNAQMEADLAGIKRLIDEEENFTPEEAATALGRLAEANGVDTKTTVGWLKSMYTADASKRTKLKAKAEKEQEKLAKEQLVKDRVETALKGDSGLASVGGTVTTVDNNGFERAMPAKEYGVKVLKDSVTKDAMAQIDRKEMDPQRAPAIIDRIVYEKLAKHGVIDKEHGDEIGAALRGDILNKDGTMSQDAVHAFDFWLQMANNPNVGPEYMAQMVTDPDARRLMKTAALMYSGRLDIEGALRKASLRISQGADVDQRIKLNEKHNAQIGKGADDAVAELMNDPWLSFDPFTEGERANVGAKRGAYREEIVRRANGYMAQNPQVDTQTHIEMAVEDFKNDSVVVNGSLITGSEAQGTRLDQVMGVQDFGKDAAERALDSYMAEFGEDLFPNLLTGPGNEERTQGWGSYLLNLGWDTTLPGAAINSLTGMEQVNTASRVPIYDIEYNSTDGTVAIQLWKSPERKELIGKPQFVNASEMGAYWLESQKKAPLGMETYRAVKETVVDTVNKHNPESSFPWSANGPKLGDLFDMFK